MQKDPSRRYASVDRLDEDIRRYLEGFPIQARPDTVVYRARKFYFRHRLSTSLAALLLVVLITFAIGISVLARRLARERDTATRRTGDGGTGVPVPDRFV